MTERQTAFPRVQVQSIEVRQITGEGRKKPRSIGQFFATEGEETALERATEIMNPNHKLIYNLTVTGMSKTGAASTARAYVRAKNLFEPSIIDIESVTQTSGGVILERYAESLMGNIPDELPDVVDSYSVRVSVEK